MAYDQITIRNARVWDKEKAMMITVTILVDINKEALVDALAQKAFNNPSRQVKTGMGSITVTYVPKEWG